MLTATSLSEVLNGQFSSLLSFPKMSSHIYLCAVDGIHGTIEKSMRGSYVPSKSFHVTLRRWKNAYKIAVSCTYSRLVG